MPWFKFNAADWLIGTAGMSHSAKGLYIDCLCYQWHGKAIPADYSGFARIFAGATAEQFEEVSAHFNVETMPDGRIIMVNHRLDFERMDALERKQTARDAAAKRWQCEPICEDDADAMLEQCEPNATQEYREKKQSKRDRDRISWDAVHGFGGLLPSTKAEWAEAYGVDVERELQKAHQWVLANPGKRKKNWRAFLTNWLSRAASFRPVAPPGRDESHIPEDCHPSDRRLFFMSDGRTPRTPLAYRKKDGTFA